MYIKYLIILLFFFILFINVETKKKKRKLYIPRIIHQTWKDNMLPTDVMFDLDNWSTTCVELHPRYQYMFWTDITLRQFIKENYSWFLPYYDGFDLNIKRIDAARYFLLMHFGGIYIDMDFICLKNFEPILKGHRLVLGYNGEDISWSHSIPNALMASSPHHPVWKKVIDIITARSNVKEAVEYCTGPVMLYQVLLDYARNNNMDDIIIYPPHFFYPTNWNNLPHEDWLSYHQIYRDNPLFFQEEFPNSYAFTFWSHSWHNSRNNEINLFSKKTKNYQIEENDDEDLESAYEL